MSDKLFRIEILQPRFDEVYTEYASEFDTKAPPLEEVEFPYMHIDTRLKKCVELCSTGNFAEGVEKSFKIVRERLRELTGYETASDAFGKGGLHIKGAAAPHVDEDFNRASQFLMMSIDRFRNEKSHTADGNIDNNVRALQYLHISSLALQLLDNAEIKDK